MLYPYQSSFNAVANNYLKILRFTACNHIFVSLYEESSLKTTIVWLSTSSDANNWLSKSAWWKKKLGEMLVVNTRKEADIEFTIGTFMDPTLQKNMGLYLESLKKKSKKWSSTLPGKMQLLHLQIRLFFVGKYVGISQTSTENFHLSGQYQWLLYIL